LGDEREKNRQAHVGSNAVGEGREKPVKREFQLNSRVKRRCGAKSSLLLPAGETLAISKVQPTDANVVQKL